MYSLETFLFKEGGKSAPSVCPKSFLLNWDPLMDPLLLPLRGKTCFPLWRLFSDCFLTREPETSLECPFLEPSPHCRLDNVWLVLSVQLTLENFTGTVLLSELVWTADISWQCCKRHACVLTVRLCPTLCDPMDCSSPDSSVHGDSPGRNIGGGCHALLQGIFPTQGLNPCLPHCGQILY